MTEHVHIGKPLRRIDGWEKTMGQTKYAGDLRLPGLLYARPVLSPHAHARIARIDKADALDVPGVVAVLTAADLPLRGMRSGSRHRSPLATTHALFCGHPVAVVLAESESAAQDGADHVHVEYEPLPAVVDPVAAMAEDAPVVQTQVDEAEAQEESQMHAAVSAQEESPEEAAAEHFSKNVTNRVHIRRGDIARAFAAADVVIEQTYRTSMVHQSYMEPQVALASSDPQGNVTLWASTQALFYGRSEVADALGLPEHRVNSVPVPVGGGFGGKFVLIEPLVAGLARAAQRPVLLSFTRSEDLLAANPAPQTVITLKMGAHRDGTLTAIQATAIFDSGAYPGTPAGIATLVFGGYYRCPNLDIRAYEVLTHKPGVGAYRAPGAPQATFALESHMDAMARALGLDPLEFRLRNAVQEGDQRPDGRVWPAIGLKDCLEQVRAQPLWRGRRAELAVQTAPEGGYAATKSAFADWTSRRQEPAPTGGDRAGWRVGVGLAIGGWPGGLEPAAAACRLEKDGTITVVVGSTDMTGTFTSYASIAAEVLGVRPEQVAVVQGDTMTAPYAGATGGSKATYTVGAAVQRAAADARQQLIRMAADVLEAAPADLETVDGYVTVRGAPGKGVSFVELAQKSMNFGARYEPVYGRGASAITDAAPMFAAHLARVAVDPETGEVAVLDYVAAQDVGFAINPAEVEGQIRGGVVQGIGWALYEQMVYDEQGQLLSSTFMDYALPNSEVAPPRITPLLVHVPAAHGPFGAKGVGEPPVVPVAAAVANAIYDAVGVRVTHLPITPERLYRALRERGEG
jgi:CO/xanthine dehydrogenase Mo-binding subunit